MSFDPRRRTPAPGAPENPRLGSSYLLPKQEIRVTRSAAEGLQFPVRRAACVPGADANAFPVSGLRAVMNTASALPDNFGGIRSS